MTTDKTPETCWIDRDALRRLLDVLGDDPDEFAELMEDYLVDAPDLVHRMRMAAETRDVDAFRIAAHTLKSNARDFGASRLSALCAAAEEAASAALHTDELATRAEEIAKEEEAAREALARVDPRTLGQGDTE